MTQNSQNNLENNEVPEGLTLDFKTYYNTMLIRTVRCWHQRNKYSNQIQ